MAIKISGTTVIDDSRALVNISNLSSISGAAIYKNSTFTLSANSSYLIDTSAGGFTGTLPTAPTSGTYVTIIDATNNWVKNNFTLSPGGSDTISGSASSLICNLSGYEITLLYKSSNWSII